MIFWFITRWVSTNCIDRWWRNYGWGEIWNIDNSLIRITHLIYFQECAIIGSTRHRYRIISNGLRLFITFLEAIELTVFQIFILFEDTRILFLFPIWKLHTSYYTYIFCWEGPSLIDALWFWYFFHTDRPKSHSKIEFRKVPKIGIFKWQHPFLEFDEYSAWIIKVSLYDENS